ncbi:histidine kinase domain containing protein [Pyrenophora tritici-repentis]|uniref:Histidine kinase domain containing protein n=2 Tax=Pyrenophora tritici-repentis TaxID=45151 RepID=A0A922NNS8_9PLEO|nr:histidine kinase domain containing protein [Pyrenophora tritici-repentis]
MPSAEHARPRILDLDDLESDIAPLFVIRTGQTALTFQPLFYNERFRQLHLHGSILAQNKEALLFRSWAQALGDFNPEHEFGGRTWIAESAGRNGDWKVVKAKVGKERKQLHQISEEDAADDDGRTPILTRSKPEFIRGFKRDRKISLKDIPRTNLHARWESIQTMMEMSDVGVFEYNSEGKLLHANEAWYRLSSLPREGEHPEFSFMDLVHPEDQTLVMSMWNNLALGKSVTFEMRWKARPGSNDSAQWVLSACVPVFDDDKQLIGIAGNTIDINAQKKSQAAAQAQVEALEQARLAEMKFARFAQVSPVAIYIYVPESGMNFVNDQFYELTGHAHAPVNQFEWFDLISDEDVERVKRDWGSMLRGDKTDAVQFRLKKTWVNQDGKRSNIWVQSSSYPELDESGKVISIMGTLFDISQFKWAESVQRRRIEEAWEAKRQQENFIDMTSHELRNPLSAVIQCADSVIASLHHLSGRQLMALHPDHDLSKAESELMGCLEALQIIVSCSMHQKRVIDDVLTLSKLDSNLILITPMRVQPAVVVSDAVRMFEVECNQAGIQLDFTLDETFSGMEWTMLDPSRLLQVLINLLTNAIKFTKDRPEKSIKVTLGGSWSRPPKCWQDITFTNDDVSDIHVTDKSEWGEGKKAYLWLKVKDTGCGMTTDEQKKLFSRFSQATPRTHVKYGGSGLGLFISKSLTKLQGGSIGVNSVKEGGSTFAFYVSTRLAHPPADNVTARAVQARPVPHRTMTGEQAMQMITLNVLIVEDNLVNQKVLKKQLMKFGWNISVAGNGQEALDWLKDSVYWHNEDDDPTTTENKHELDIILMDIEMPIMDGLTCARLIRDYEHQGLLVAPRPGPSPHRRASAKSISPIRTEEDRRSSDAQIVQSPTSTSHERPDRQSLRLPILAVSANARMEQIEQALSAGMDDAISKPFRIPELWPKIRGLVKRVAHVDTRAKP